MIYRISFFFWIWVWILVQQDRGASVFLLAAGRWCHVASRTGPKLHLTLSEKQGKICSEKRPWWIYQTVSSFPFFWVLFRRNVARWNGARPRHILSLRLANVSLVPSNVKKKKSLKSSEKHQGVVHFALSTCGVCLMWPHYKHEYHSLQVLQNRVRYLPADNSVFGHGYVFLLLRRVWMEPVQKLFMKFESVFHPSAASQALFNGWFWHSTLF